MTATADHETTAAVDALVWRLRNREPGTDDEIFAREYLIALRARGWRPTEARKPADWQPPKPGGSAEPGDDYRAALDEVREKARRDARLLGHDNGIGAA
jgi:hypothetical protein